MPNLPQFNVDEGIQRLMEIETLECICHLRPTHLTWEDPEEIPFTMTVKINL